MTKEVKEENEEFELDRQVHEFGLDYLRWLRDANQASGKGLGAMLMEMVKLMLGPGKVQPENYFMYRLYDDKRYTPEAKKTFIGQFGPQVESPWASVANDKLTMCALLKGLDMPIPQIQALWHPCRTFPGAEPIRSKDDAVRFLREDACYPIFGKPLDSVCSLGTAAISAYEESEDVLIMRNGQRTSVKDFVNEASGIGTNYMFQSLLLPNEDLIPIIGDRLSTVRMFVMQDENGFHLFRASWKIPGGDGPDNFWRPGNMLAGIDVETGKITRSFLRKDNGDIEEIETHPESSVQFHEVTFPHWKEMRTTVLEAAANLDGCYLQGWDVALTSQGPVLIELEGDGGDPIMEQLCFDSGLLQDRFFKVMEFARKNKTQFQDAVKARKKSILKQRLSALGGPDQQDEQQPEPAQEDQSKEAAKSEERDLATVADN